LTTSEGMTVGEVLVESETSDLIRVGRRTVMYLVTHGV